MQKRQSPAPQEKIFIKRHNKKYVVVDTKGHIYVETEDFNQAKKYLESNDKYMNYKSPDRFDKLKDQELDDWFRNM